MAIIEKVVTTYIPKCDDCGEELDSSPTRTVANNRLKFHSQTDCVVNDHRCSNCGTTLRSCSRRLARGVKACCDVCADVEVHNVDLETSTASFRDARQWYTNKLNERAR